MRCAFLSMDSLEGFYSYDEMLIEPLRSLGWMVELVPWRREHEDWSRFDAVVIRTPWDYFADPGAFIAVLREIDRSTRLENPLDVIIWNLDKRYLLDLESRGVPIVPTVVLDGDRDEAVIRRCRSLSEELIFKPVVSANAANTHRIDAADLSNGLPFDTSPSEAWLAQPFVRSVLDEGEISLFYFAGEYSHAITKRPAPNDFRVQEEHGGILSSLRPTEDMLAAGARVIEAIGRDLLYARVDLVRFDDRWVLMELELIEPSLYFNMDPDSPARFARAFEQWFGCPTPDLPGESKVSSE